MHGRNWWARWRAGFATHWMEDRAFRSGLSLLLTAIALAGIGGCALLTNVMGHTLVPQWFHAEGIIRVDGGGQSANYPIGALRPAPTPPDVAPVAVATSLLGAPVSLPTPTPTPNLTPTPQPTPTPAGIPTVTPTPPGPTCPPLAGSPQLTGRTVQDGTNPTPLLGGCPAQLMIAAPSQVNAVITGTLTFGTRNPTGCTVQLNGTTNAAGNAQISFTVPGTDCFRGSVTTNGTLTVGGDNSANANFQAEG